MPTKSWPFISTLLDFYTSRYQTGPSSTALISKKSFLSNLETRVHKPNEPEKSSRALSRLPFEVVSAPVVSYRAPPCPQPPERKLDASLPDEAFLDVDIDGASADVPVLGFQPACRLHLALSIFCIDGR